MPMVYFARKLTGRCVDGFERGKGKVSHAVATDTLPCREKALCGAAPGRLSNGWAQPDQVERVTCVRCSARLQKAAASHGAMKSGTIRWCWYGTDDGGQVWTAASGTFYLEVNGTTGKCEIAEWDPESADIGRTLWEATQPTESVDGLQRIVEDALNTVRDTPSDQASDPVMSTVASSAALNIMLGELLAILQSAGRLTLADALLSAARHKLHESASLIVLARVAADPSHHVTRYYVDRSGASARLLDEDELREVIEERFALEAGRSRASAVEVVWATSFDAAVAANTTERAAERFQ